MLKVDQAENAFACALSRCVSNASVHLLLGSPLHYLCHLNEDTTDAYSFHANVSISSGCDTPTRFSMVSSQCNDVHAMDLMAPDLLVSKNIFSREGILYQRCPFVPLLQTNTASTSFWCRQVTHVSSNPFCLHFARVYAASQTQCAVWILSKLASIRATFQRWSHETSSRLQNAVASGISKRP